MVQTPGVPVWFLLACTPASIKTDTPVPETPVSCEATINPTISLVIDIQWTPVSVGHSYVEFGDTPERAQRTPTSDDADVSLHLIGNPADSTIYYRAVTESESGNEVCEGTILTGSAPAGIPPVTVAKNDSDLQDPASYVIGGFFSPIGKYTLLAAYRRDGKVVWYHEGNDGGTTVDSHYDRNGNGLLYNVFVDGEMGGEKNRIQQITLWGEEINRWDTPLAQHTFAQLPDGTLAYQATDIRPYTETDGTKADWVGDAIVEISPSGEQKTVFSVWDWLTPTRNDRINDRSIYPGLDWTHGNLISYDDTDDQYLLSLGHADDILMISRADGSPTRIYGADGVAANPGFDYQHNPVWLDNGHLLMFMTENRRSGAIEYALDGDGVPQEVWRYGFEKEAFALGQAQRLRNGNTYINYGAIGRMQEVTPDGTVVWDISGPSSGPGGALFGQFHLVSNLYTGE